jgi:regulator of protease activity HflC (stomatin/prohibitin superfamily)
LPSILVLTFETEVREEVKGRDLSFTEIAQLVGKRWQLLAPETRKNLEREADMAKEKYSAAVTEYKMTPQYAQYRKYLADFNAKYAASSPGKL